MQEKKISDFMSGEISVMNLEMKIQLSGKAKHYSEFKMGLLQCEYSLKMSSEHQYFPPWSSRVMEHLLNRTYKKL